MTTAEAAQRSLSSEGLHARGRAALARRDWTQAHSALAAAAAEREHEPEILEDLGLAAFWLEDGESALAARQRAYTLYLRQGDARSAGRIATWLAWDHSAFRGQHALAGGWLTRAHRALDPLAPGREHAWLALREAARVIGEDPRRARTLGAHAAGLGCSLGLHEDELAGHAIEGLALVSLGQVGAGMALLERATRAERQGTLTDLVLVTLVYSQMIDACERTRDYERLLVHCTRLLELCQRWCIRGLIGVTRAHRSVALIAQGEWGRAEAELTAAATQIEQTVPGMLPEALLRLAELRRGQGALARARELVARCPNHALTPLIAASVELEVGACARAAKLARDYLDGVPGHGRIERAPALELLVRAETLLGRPTEPALQELLELAGGAGCDGIDALAGRAAGAAALAAGRPDLALDRLGDALARLERHGPRYEAGRTRLELARALRAAGNRAQARREAHRAEAELAGLGAGHASRDALRLVQAIDP